MGLDVSARVYGVRLVRNDDDGVEMPVTSPDLERQLERAMEDALECREDSDWPAFRIYRDKAKKLREMLEEMEEEC